MNLFYNYGYCSRIIVYCAECERVATDFGRKKTVVLGDLGFQTYVPLNKTYCCKKSKRGCDVIIVMFL
jgi:hypothetical protein